MKIVFRTNIDAYKRNCFPEDFTTPPRTGDFVYIVEVFVSHYQTQKLPIRLEVASVHWTEKSVICELWYNENDRKIAEMKGAKTF